MPQKSSISIELPVPWGTVPLRITAKGVVAVVIAGFVTIIALLVSVHQ